MLKICRLESNRLGETLIFETAVRNLENIEDTYDTLAESDEEWSVSLLVEPIGVSPERQAP
jgi:hypothetical protein